MMHLSRARLVIATASLAALGLLMLVDRASYRCMQEGGHFELMRWTCVSLPPVILDRNLRRS